MNFHFSLDLSEARVFPPRGVAHINPDQNRGAQLDTFVDPLEGAVHVAQFGIELGDDKCIVMPMTLFPALQRQVNFPLQNTLAAGASIDRFDFFQFRRACASSSSRLKVFLDGLLCHSLKSIVVSNSITEHDQVSWIWVQLQRLFILRERLVLSAGSTYIYTITLNDGSTIVFQFGLR